MTDWNERRTAKESLLGDESLTSELTDEASRILLDWGTCQVEAASRRAQALSDVEFGARLSHLRRVMRRINKRAGQASPVEQPERVRSLLSSIDTSDETTK